MCGIAGIHQIKQNTYPHLHAHLDVMNRLQKHRGPDGEGIWKHPNRFIGFAHRRLNIIDIEMGLQPMQDCYGNTICYNGEIYNYLELRAELKDYPFKTHSDTETILAAYQKWGKECVNHLRGMFAFAIWDETNQRLFCARDRFGIKPFYFTEINHTLYFASEAKALLPFLPSIETNLEALQDYLVFQFSLGTKTLFKNIQELPPAYSLTVEKGKHVFSKYWEVYYDLDFDHTSRYFEEKLKDLIEDSVKLHGRSDVPVGVYISGGIDSGIISAVTAQCSQNGLKGFNGKFDLGSEYDESEYARLLAKENNIELHEVNITSEDFLQTIHQIIYHLDYPIAGPGSFPQYHVAKLASQHCKVVLGGQGGDEIFGGYARYLIAYFEQCIKAAINGTMDNGNFIVTYESIIPNLASLKNYKPLLQEFWREGLFEDIDSRYFRLINRAPSLQDEIRWECFGPYSPFKEFQNVFHGKNVTKESYFDSMTHFDFKTLLRALLHVEDRMSMAHGIESRVPFLDHPLIEFAATMPSNIKFKDGTLKKVLINTMQHVLPQGILNRKDKMGFPVPLNHWLKNDLKDFAHDIFSSQSLQSRPYFNSTSILKNLGSESKFGRKIWGLLSLELWHRLYHDRAPEFRKMVRDAEERIPFTTLSV
ncbi:asparagine synthase (glutamine-hydrolyzing) [Parachlamydia acanthamoebae]|uniref:asparagine synthase (glutamine-hydrolyzing) n=2 Tax=Parachlamydia acanthamoebae TaxID=83552 RepID=F8KY43_PARAV|nr:asparagine synthase (glutamine-hydrolyzing) [Parachlamydia acanthamoebae]CCB87677.1 asparagine synthetase [glutamine-hydrolyzing] 1 [Parachlamydia acanthamoebae UV-7]